MFKVIKKIKKNACVCLKDFVFLCLYKSAVKLYNSFQAKTNLCLFVGEASTSSGVMDHHFHAGMQQL